MSFGVNECTLVGRIANDPVSGTTQSGKKFIRFQIAVQRIFNGKPVADFFSVALWEKTAIHFADKLRKGLLVLCIGEISIDKRKTDDGKMYTNVNMNPRKYFNIIGSAEEEDPNRPPEMDEDGLPY